MDRVTRGWLALFVAVLSVTANADSIVGTWQIADDPSASFQFNEDGTVEIRDSGKVLKTTFRHEEPNRIVMKFSDDPEDPGTVFEYELRLVLKSENSPDLQLSKLAESTTKQQSGLKSEQVAGALSETAELRIAMAEFYAVNQRLPKSLAEAGVAKRYSVLPDYIRDISLDAGTVRVVLQRSNNEIDSGEESGIILLMPKIYTNGGIGWNCESQNIQADVLPDSCKP